MKNGIGDARLMSIGEIASALRITRRIILNYEERGLLRPDVKEGLSGNRYYTPDTLTRIRTIRVLQDLGLSLDEIRSYFDDKTDLEPLINRLETMRDELSLSIEKLRARQCCAASGIDRVTLPHQKVYRRTFFAKTVEQRKEHLRDIIPAAMRAYGSDTGKRMYFIEYPILDPDTISYCVSIPENSAGEFVCEFEKAPALCVTWHGGYDELSNVRETIITWAKNNQVPLAGSCRHIYLEGPPHHKDERMFITQVALPIAVNEGGRTKSKPFGQ